MTEAEVATEGSAGQERKHTENEADEPVVPRTPDELSRISAELLKGNLGSPASVSTLLIP